MQGLLRHSLIHLDLFRDRIISKHRVYSNGSIYTGGYVRHSAGVHCGLQ
jgi:hypothetical protein